MSKSPSTDKKETAPMKPAPVFKINRFQIGTNVLIQIVLVIFLVGLANFTAFRFYERWDFSRDDRFTLSEQTNNILKSLPDKVRFVVFFSPGSPVFKNLDSLLKEYQYAGGRQIEIEYVDPYRNFNRARDLQAEYRFEANENVVIVTYKDQSKFINEMAMGEIDDSGAILQQPPRLVEFSGEQALTSAIIELTEERETVMAVLQGQGQPTIGEDSTLSALLRFVERQYVRPIPLDLATVDEIPGEVDIVLLAGARYDLPTPAMEKLNAFWQKQGRLVVLLDPNARTPNLDAFLSSYGIVPNNDRVLRTVNLGTVTGVVREVSAEFLGDSPVTRSLAGVTSLFTGASKSITLDKAIPGAENIRLTPVLQASEGYWGETNFNSPEGSPIIFEPKEDTHPPIRIGATAEMGGLSDERLQINSSRMLVVSNADFILDGTLDQLNLDFLINALNWLTNREQMIGIAAKEVKLLTLSLPQEQVANIGFLTMGAMPAAAAALGLLVFLRRRK